MSGDDIATGPGEMSHELVLRAEWMKQAHETKTKEDLLSFIDKLEKYPHDYGTICRAIAAVGLAAMKAVDRGPHGGITGFQAGCIIWDVIKEWGVWGDGPKQMLCFNNLLYPQYEKKFRCISKDTWQYLQDEAKKKINEHPKGKGVDPGVYAHWKKVAAGYVPFGFRVSEEED